MRGKFYQLFVKRVIDIAIAATVLVLCSPIMALIALYIRFTMGSPVIFKQQRAGYKGKPFYILKFRSMSNDMDSHGNLLPDSQRLTRFGKFLRSTSLDELPGLLMVVRGEMSLVGPRPLPTTYLPRYTPEQNRRHDVMPGIVSWASVNGRNRNSWERKFELDLYYVNHQSLWLDALILTRTIFTVLSRKGVNESDEVTATEFLGSTHSTPCNDMDRIVTKS